VAPKIMAAVHQAIAAGCVRACHDLSEGGLAVAAAEMAFAGDLGLDLSLAAVPREEGLDDDGRILFSESTTRFLVEAPRKRAEEFEKLMAGLPYARVGEVACQGIVRIKGIAGKAVVSATCEVLREAWKRPLAW